MDYLEKINNSLLEIIQQLKNIIEDINNKKPKYSLIKNIKDLIKSTNQIIENNKANTLSMKKNFDNLITENNFKDITSEEVDVITMGNHTWGKKDIFTFINNFNIHRIQIYPDGKYIGEFKNGMRDGKGIFYFNDGARYEGDYKCDKREGKGILYYPNGNIYQGDYKNNKKDGQGIMYYNNGTRAMGNYLNSNPVGKHIVLDNFGNYYCV